MVADTYDGTLGLIIQGTGNNNNSWGDTFNNSMLSPAVRALAGVNLIPDTSGTVNLDDVLPPAGLREDIDLVQKITGAVSPSITIEVTNRQKLWLFWHAGSSGFVYVKVNGGGTVQIPIGTMKWVWCDGNLGVYRIDADHVGELVMSGKATADVGTLLCNGASLLRADYPDLYNKIGVTWGSVDGVHFTLPDFVTNNRFLRAAGGAIAVATTQSNQNKAHTHTGSGTTAINSVGHTHTFSGTTGGQSADHTHNFTGFSGGALNAGGGAGGDIGGTYTTTGVSAGHTHAFSGTTAGQSVDHTHTFSFTTASDGGTEARPENAAVIMAIRY